jgi:hypothetical protein
MANRWKGNFVVAAATTSSGTDYTGKANGAWGLNSQLQQKQASLWALGVHAPNAPTIGTATSGDTLASVNFTGSTDSGGGTILSYTATSTPGNITSTSATSPILVTGLTNGTTYTFTVHANSSLGYTSAESASSNSVTPQALANIVAVSYSDSPYISAYKWLNGFVSKYSNPATTLPSAAAGGIVSINNNFPAISITSTASPFIYVYAWSGGFSTLYNNPSTLPTSFARYAKFNPAGTAIAVAHRTEPFITVYPWSNGFGTKYADPSTLPADNCWCTNFNTTGNVIAAGYNFTYSMALYPWSNGFGTKYANQSTQLRGTVRGFSFKSDNSAMAVSFDNGPQNCYVFAWSNSTGFGTKYADPAISLDGRGNDVSFTNSGNAIAVISSNGGVVAFPWNNGFGTKYADPSTPFSIYGVQSIKFTQDDSAIFIAGGYTPLDSTSALNAYAWSTSGFGTIYTAPSTQPSPIAYSVDYSLPI